MRWIKEATIGTYPIGPFMDGSGAILGSLNIIMADIFLAKQGGIFGTISGTPTAYADRDGYYKMVLDTTDTDTRGVLRAYVNKATALPLWEDFMVVPTLNYDSLFGTDRFQVDMRELGDASLDFTPTMQTRIGSITAIDRNFIIGSLGDLPNIKGSLGYLPNISGSLGYLPGIQGSLGYLPNILGSFGQIPSMNTKLDTISGYIDTEVAAIKAKTDNLPSGVPKNVALSNFTFLMTLSSNHVTPATGKTITAEISQGGGAFAACTNAVTEIGSGFYKINLTQTEMNATIIGLKFTETDCDQRSITIVTSI